MPQNYYCYVRDKFGKCLEDGYTDVVLCIINSLDFPKLIYFGYSIEIVDTLDFSMSSAMRTRYRRLSYRITEYILSFNKLPLKRRL